MATITPAARQAYLDRAAAQKLELERDIQEKGYAWHTETEKFTLGLDALRDGRATFTITEWAEYREEVTATKGDLRTLRDYLNTLDLSE